ncbi:MAG: MmgE/PrpD family protein [Proteobacteria bacterium]|nr:MmgE/PrpD family protein [Pseudomonadota bacterium]
MNASTPSSVFNPTAALAQFASQLQASNIPEAVFRRCEDLFVDWTASALAGYNARAVSAIRDVALGQGPGSGPSEILGGLETSSPFCAAMANAAASHVVEQDDLHNASVLHPATVVFPPALATAQSLGISGREFLTACVAGYEVGIRVGEFLGRSHYKTFHTTATAGTLAAAATVGRLLQLSPSQMLHALGSAGTQAAGLWAFLRDAADSKQLHTAHASGAGLMAAFMAQKGLTGAQDILTGQQGMAQGMSSDSDPSRLTDRFGDRWALMETSFKYHASCRHTHPAVDALLKVLKDHALNPSEITTVVARVHQGALDVLGPVTNPQTVHQSKFSMGTVLALAAHYGFAGLTEFESHFNDESTIAFRNRVTMVLDPEVDAAYPAKWIGKVTVTTKGGQVLEGRVDDPKGDPGNTLSRKELEEKMHRLSDYGNRLNKDATNRLLSRLWATATLGRLDRLIPKDDLHP